MQVAAKCCWQSLGYYSFYTMSANTFVDLQVSAAVVYAQYIRKEVRREERIG